MQIKVNKRNLENSNSEGGLDIIIEGVIGDPAGDPLNPCPVFIEYFNGKYRVFVWNNTQDPQIIVLEQQK